MITVKIKAEGVKLTPSQPTVTSGSFGSIRIDFAFDTEWQGLYKTAVFDTPRGRVCVLLEDDYCILPSEALECGGSVGVGVFGTDGERTLTSLQSAVRISCGTATDVSSAENYVPSMYEQLVERFAHLEEIPHEIERAIDEIIALEEQIIGGAQ